MLDCYMVLCDKTKVGYCIFLVGVSLIKFVIVVDCVCIVQV